MHSHKESAMHLLFSKINLVFVQCLYVFSGLGTFISTFSKFSPLLLYKSPPPFEHIVNILIKESNYGRQIIRQIIRQNASSLQAYCEPQIAKSKQEIPNDKLNDGHTTSFIADYY